MSVPFTAVTAGVPLQTLALALYTAMREHGLIYGGSQDLTGTNQIQGAFWWVVQDWVRDNYAGFVDHVNGPFWLNPGDIDSGFFPYWTTLYWTEAAFLSAAGLPADLFTAGFLGYGDPIIPFVGQLQDAYSMLRWTMDPGTGASQSRELDISSFGYNDNSVYTTLTGSWAAVPWGPLTVGAEFCYKGVEYRTDWERPPNPGTAQGYGTHRVMGKGYIAGLPSIPVVADLYLKGSVGPGGGGGTFELKDPVYLENGVYTLFETTPEFTNEFDDTTLIGNYEDQPVGTQAQFFSTTGWKGSQCGYPTWILKWNFSNLN